MSIATVVFVIVRGPLGIPRSGVWRFVPLMMGLSPIVVSMPVGHWMLRGIRREWHATGGRLCTHCAYDVSDLAPAGTCPECGGAYDIAADAEIWAASGLMALPQVAGATKVSAEFDTRLDAPRENAMRDPSRPV